MTAALVPSGTITSLTLVRAGLVVTGAVLLGLAGWVARHRDAPTLRPFVGLVGIVGLLAVVDGIVAADTQLLAVVWLCAYLFIPTAFALFVVEYYGLPHLASRPRKLLFAAPAVLAAVGGTLIIFEPSTAGAMAGGGTTGAAAQLPAAVLSAARIAEQLGLYYAGGVMLVASALLARTARAYEHLDTRLGVVLSFVAVWPWIAYLLTPAFAGSYPVVWLVGVTAAGYGLSAAGAAFAVTRGGLFDAAPAAGTLGPESVLANLDDVVVVVDQEGRVVRLNAAARDTFAVDPAAVAGEPLASVLGVDLNDVQGAETLELAVRSGTRQFEATVTEVRDRHGRSPGHAVVLQDVTRQRVRAQRLTVLNRVLRHNLRNEMSAIMGRAQVIADDDRYDEAAGSILAAADDLVSLGERARDVERMMAVDIEDDPRTVVAEAVTGIVEDHRAAYPAAEIAVDVAPSLVAAVDHRVLERVLDNLVDNAVVHNDAHTPVVTVSARETETGTISLSVADNGPGLPEQERAVLEAGDESPLEHGSGIGLWAVVWGATRMGATIAFDENQPRGTVVSLELPSEQAASGEPPAESAAAD